MTDFGAEFETAMPPPPPRPIELEDVDDTGWWMSVLLGVALVAVGIWLLTNLYESVTVLAVLVGVSLIVGGVAEIVAMGGHNQLGLAGWLGGGLVIALGVAVLAWPDITLWTVAVIAGCGLMLAGLLRVTLALEGHRVRSDWPFQLALGGLFVVLGAAVVAWPEATLQVLGFLLGVKAVVSGLFAIGTGWQVHQLASG
ncbi:MAG: HdeD family acid-resistance protein [Acidimicrobiales bacterium]